MCAGHQSFFILLLNKSIIIIVASVTCKNKLIKFKTFSFPFLTGYKYIITHLYKDVNIKIKKIYKKYK